MTTCSVSESTSGGACGIAGRSVSSESSPVGELAPGRPCHATNSEIPSRSKDPARGMAPTDFVARVSGNSKSLGKLGCARHTGNTCIWVTQDGRLDMQSLLQLISKDYVNV